MQIIKENNMSQSQVITAGKPKPKIKNEAELKEKFILRETEKI